MNLNKAKKYRKAAVFRELEESSCRKSDARLTQKLNSVAF